MKIEVKNLVRHFGQVCAVNDISFNFEAGNIYGFVGPNGAGKTTTMRIMATLDEPCGGDILLDGVSLVDRPEFACMKIGFMPDALPEHGDITVEEYVDFFARSYGLKGQNRTRVVEGVIEFANLRGIRQKFLRALSKGMKQRVSLARTIVHDPDVLILDEPAAGLDPRARVELRELLRILSSQGKAILISSHILTELSEICNGAIIIEQGRILRAGSIEDLVAEHQHTNQGEILIRAIEISPEELLRKAMIMPGVDSAMPMPPNGTIRVLTEAGDVAAARLLQQFLDSGIQIADFHSQHIGLEDVFMAITEGKVQ